MEKVIREHHLFAFDLTEAQEYDQMTKDESVIGKIRTLLEEAEEAGEIKGYVLDHNFDEDITAEYQGAL